jgi:hypothetical protein
MCYNKDSQEGEGNGATAQAPIKKTSKQFENPLDNLKNKCYNKDVRSRETAQPQKSFQEKIKNILTN